MGSTNSKLANTREPPVSWRAAIWRRLQIWRELRPYFIQVAQAVGLGTTSVPASGVSLPQPHANPSSGRAEDEAVSVVETMLANALRARSADAEDAEGQPLSQGAAARQAVEGGRELNQYQSKDALPNDDSPPQHTEATMPKSSKSSARELTPELTPEADLVRAMRMMDTRLLNLEEPVRLLQSPEDEELVVQIFRSSLDVVLPRVAKRNHASETSSSQDQPPVLSYRDMKRSTKALEDASQANTAVRSGGPSTTSSAEGPLPVDVLPAPIQQQLNRAFENYLTWDKKLYADLRLDSMSQSIRLIEIHPGPDDETVPIVVDLIRVPLEEARNTYEALSYTWGSPTPSETMTVNGVQVKIGMWLFGALVSLRRPDTRRRLWVDAVCINQASVAERSIEVQKMGEIYRSASEVAIFHGWPSRTTREGSLITALFEFLLRSQDSQASGDEDPFEKGGFNRAVVCKGFIDFCCRPWWRRVWTIQEFYLATKEPVWYWGFRGVSNAVLKRDIPLLMEASWAWYSGGRGVVEDWILPHIERATGAKTADQFSHEIHRISELIQRRFSTHGLDIPSRLYRSLSARATDPRDLVYGLREIFDPVFRRVFVPDYTMRLELLYACLAVFLIQFEGWGDMLWWYPHRFDDEAATEFLLPSWLPDFTKRAAPPATELLPRDHLGVAGRAPQLRLIILDHALHAEGRRLDTVDAVLRMGSGDDELENGAVLRNLWGFDADHTRPHSYAEYTPTEEEQQNPLFDRFLKICRSVAAQDDCGIAHPRLPVAAWAGNFSASDNLPAAIAECVPSWNVLFWHAFKTGSQTVAELFGGMESTEPALLADIFSPRLDDAFRKILATDFLGDCVFGWGNLGYVLECLKRSSLWQQTSVVTRQDDSLGKSVWSDANASDLATSLRSFLRSAATGLPVPLKIGETLDRYLGLCSLILLDANNYAEFTRIVDRLSSAGEELHRMSLDWRIQAQIDDLESRDEVVATRIRRNDAIRTHFNMRFLFRTRRGFHGLTAPGVEPREGDEVVLLDGLSFPVLVRSFKDNAYTGRFAGCAVVRGVDLSEVKSKSPKVPEGCVLGEKRLFKLI
ncbi:heterokaryon incompatibility protein-domain-containing protein [Echria macrotheca]|uniref:Heterokaryon incompatibility protein-domain-containing protein n=1 Tax=Echria macrotheca TaxID=438768 RepID=A0AAJ0F0U5_9PEZI|nr:heterokaryon incompatibility protein-domain-containing protein [Echria macrotheca]